MNPRILLPCLALLACGRDTRDADPYAARYATEKPAYVRTASAVSKPAVPDSAIDPTFTEAQADAGAEVYTATCARCHASAQWQGGTFAAGWRDRRVSDFYDLVSGTMPQDAPGTLSTEQYVDVTAYIMQLAGFKSGDVALRADSAMMRHERLRMVSTDTTKKDSSATAPGNRRRG